MLTTMETREMKRTNSILIGVLAIFLMSAGAVSAREYDRARGGHAGGRYDDSGAVRAAYRADVRLDRHGAAINHHFDVVALFAAVAGDYHLAHALDRHGDRVERRYDRRGDRIVYGAKAASHRHHDRCGHHRSRWHAKGHHVKHARGPGHGHAKRHGHGHRGHKSKGRKHHH